jgi:glucosamine 6-phosphate synthetase-like amidotransferase/phosphosugar isomerase protein
MKHGPIALIDANVPVVALAPSDALFEKTASNIQETIARGGKVLLISDEKGTKALKSQVSWTMVDAGRYSSLHRADSLCNSHPASGLSRRGGQGHGCRPAA